MRLTAAQEYAASEGVRGDTSYPAVCTLADEGGRNVSSPHSGLAERLAANRPLVWALFSIVYFIPTVLVARSKLFWDDEFFTLYLSRASSWHELLRALRTGADQHPPSFYYLTHGIITAFGTGHVTLRLPAILGFWLLCICLYEIARPLMPPLWAVVAMLFPLTTKLYFYGSEARAYGLVCGFAALAVLAWMRATSHRRRGVYLVLLGFSVACAVATHYYAAMFVACLGFGELVRTVVRRRVDIAVWIALAFSLTPIVAFASVIRSARTYSTHFWAVPVWTDILKFYSNEVALGALAIVGGVAALSCFGYRSTRGQSVETSVTSAVALPSWWSALLVALALLPFVVMGVAKYITHGFSDRYTLGAVIGLAILLPWFLSRVRPQPRFALAALLCAVGMFWFQVHVLRDDNNVAALQTKADMRDLAATGDQTIVMMDITRFHRQSYYAPRSVATRLVYLADPDASIKYLGHDTLDRGLLDLRDWFPLRTVPDGNFLAAHRDFLVFGTVTNWSWLAFDLPRWGQPSLLARGEGLTMLFAMHRTGRELVPQPDAENHRGLWESEPTRGESLCELYTRGKSCLR